MDSFNNICNCKCHELGRDKCRVCAIYHRRKDTVTHVNDKNNPNIPEDK